MLAYERENLRAALNARLKVVRRWIPQAIVAAQNAVTGGPVTLRDGYAGVRFVGKVLWNTDDLEHIRTVPEQNLYGLLIEGTIGAAQYRLEKLRKAHG